MLLDSRELEASSIWYINFVAATLFLYTSVFLLSPTDFLDNGSSLANYAVDFLLMSKLETS
jgi:hypothetical protein